MWSGRAQPRPETWACHPVGTPPAGGSKRFQTIVNRTADQAGDLGSPILGYRNWPLGHGTPLRLVGKEQELVEEVECYWLDIDIASPQHTESALEPKSLVGLSLLLDLA